MKEEDIKNLIQSELANNRQQNQFTVTPTSFHTHNGIDSPRVKQNNIINGTTSAAHLETLTSEIFTLDTIQNITQLTLCGVALNGLGQKASLNGNAQLGKCFLYSPSSISLSEITTNGGSYEPFLQTFSETYIDTSFTTAVIGATTVLTSTGLANARVLAGEGYIAAVADQNYTDATLPPNIATLSIIKWTGSSITFKSVLAANWHINFFLSMS